MAALALLLLLLELALGLAQPPNSSDAERLLAFKDTLDNGDTVLASWTAGTDPCSGWRGISCSADGRVVRTALKSAGLKGTIPAPDGWVLPGQLRELDLSGNWGLLGPLPPAWRLPAGLQALRLLRTQLNSTLSSEWLQSLPRGLAYISMQNASLWGSLPPALNLPNLAYLDLSRNQLTGTVPVWRLPGLQVFHLSTNWLSGTIPSNLTFNTSFDYSMLTLHENNLSGALPTWPNNYKTQVSIRPGNPKLCGAVPTRPIYAEMATPSNLYEPLPKGSVPACPQTGSNDSVPASGSDSSSAATIAGAVAGAIGGAVLVGVAGLAYWRKRKQRKHADQLGDCEAGKGSAGDQDSSHSSTSAGGSTYGRSSTSELLRCETPQDSGSDIPDPLLDSIQSRLQMSASSSHSGREAPRSKQPLAAAAGPMTTRALGVNVEMYTIPWAKLRVKRQIGRGSSARVYLCYWRKTLVAAKLLLGPDGCDGPDLDLSAAADRVLSLSNPVLGNLRMEANLMVALRHPNILGFLGLCLQPPMIVTEYCSRGSLYKVLKQAREWQDARKRLTWPVRLNIALGAAKGLLYLHTFSQPVLHRDFKSPNLLLDASYNAKVADFNMSRIIGESSLAFQHSTTVGNPRWLAPEVLGGGSHSFPAEVFSFAIVMWELLTLQAPWEGARNQWQVVANIIQGQRPPIPEPDQLLGGTFEGLGAYIELMKSCWAQDPADRPSFQEVAQRLRDISMQLHESASSEPTTPSAASGPSSGTFANDLIRAGKVGAQQEGGVKASLHMAKRVPIPSPFLLCQLGQ